MGRSLMRYVAVVALSAAATACGDDGGVVNDPARAGAGGPTAGGSPSGVQPTVVESPTDTGDDGVSAGDADVVARNLAYTPTQVLVDAGGDLTIANADTTVDHTFTIEDGGVDEIVAAGGEIEIVVDLDAGTYTAVCRFHDDMRVRLEVT